MLCRLTPSVGAVGDALDNALAETTIGLYKTECVRDGSAFRNGPMRPLAGEEASVFKVHAGVLMIDSSLKSRFQSRVHSADIPAPDRIFQAAFAFLVNARSAQ
jgi:transposase InsO family protein